jgi:isoamylase
MPGSGGKEVKAMRRQIVPQRHARALEQVSSTESWASAEGSPFPQGVSKIREENAYNFALYSKHAESVTLLLYAGDVVHPAVSYRMDYLKNKSGRIWHCRIPAAAITNARYYAYAVSGPPPNGRFEWHNFDPEKILLDPYAESIFFPKDFDRSAAVRPGSNAGKAPLGLIAACEHTFDWRREKPVHHESDTIIYELHVKGFTRSPNSGVTPKKRGAYLGLIENIPYLKELGVTAVELMPVFQYDPQEGNYWGYMPLNFFSPHQGYATGEASCVCQQHNEFRAMVDALHAAGIEVILDVVYNHTGEGDHNGPIYSFKGIDNSTYYLISDRPWDPYENFTGARNTLNCENRYVRKMILDSLRYWVKEMRVDGFRFDLASIFSRNEDGSIDLEDPQLFADIASDPDLAKVRLIAEPWDAAGIYQLGRSLPGITWFQWNGRFRDDARRFVKGDPGMVSSIMARLYGSDDLFPDDRMNAYHAYQSVNYIDSHDGFTFYDLVSYDRKRNLANGQDNTDGANENHSWNCGWEGDENVPDEVMRLRKRQIKNFCCLLFLANGTPMFRAGDEFMQTQGGNNNPYNQDNETSWLDWRRLDRHRDIFRFFKNMIAFRKAHRSLCRSRFWREDIRWHGVGASVDLSHDSHSLAFFLAGSSQDDVNIYVMINAYWEDLTFTIQEGAAGEWRRVIDTSLESPEDFCAPGKEVQLTSPDYVVKARSIVVLVRP